MSILTKYFSLKTTIVTSIVFMGAMVIGAVLLVDSNYRHFSLDSQTKALEQITELQSFGILAEMEKYSTDLGESLRSESAFRNALKTRDDDAMEHTLASQFHQYFVSAGLMDIKNLAVYDRDLQLLHNTPAAEEDRKAYQFSPCGDLIERARQRRGADRLRTLSGLCIIREQLHLSVLVPVGGLVASGYLEILSDPSFNLRRLENALGLPIAMHNIGGSLRYRSASWPEDQISSDSVTASVPIRTDDGQTGLIISVAHDVLDLQENMDQTRNNILTLALVATMTIIGLFLLILEKTTFAPLSRLGNGLKQVSTVTGKFSGTIETGGSREIANLTEHFNEMLLALNESYSNLESANQELANHSDQLEHEVTKRTADLELARDEALQASRAKSQFLANMSHELRTPLNAIIGYSEMLVEDMADSENQDAIIDVKKIHTAGKHLLALINDVLDLSKIEAGKMDLYIERFSVSRIINELRDTITPLIKKNHNELILVYDENIGDMNADITKLRQALFNILSNASKFTENGTITLEACRYNELGTEYISFSVIDNGIGISKDQLQKLFRAFSQADASTTRKFGGTGLGLVISRHFCRMMGGDISVTSELNKGSTFTIFLPAQVSDDIMRDSTAIESGDGQDDLDPFVMRMNAELPAIGKERRRYITKILVIDDDPSVRDLLSRFLKKEGFEAIVAHSGWKGLELARAREPDVIILDIMMPEIDGWTVLSHIKKDPGLRNIPIILLTMVDDKKMGFALGATDYMTKPIMKDDLLESIRKIIRKKPEQPVLIVEDEADIREMVSRMLTREGWNADTAENGKHALEYLQNNKPALILLDLMMPEMDGFEFISELKAHPEWREIPVIVLTAMELTEQDREFLQNGTQYVLKKGAYSTKDLLTTVHSTILKFIRKDSR